MTKKFHSNPMGSETGIDSKDLDKQWTLKEHKRGISKVCKQRLLSLFLVNSGMCQSSNFDVLIT